MNHETTIKTELSIEQQETLVEIISDQYGPCLSFDEFTDQMLLLFKDISGFEVVCPRQNQMTTPPLITTFP